MAKRTKKLTVPKCSIEFREGICYVIEHKKEEDCEFMLEDLLSDFIGKENIKIYGFSVFNREIPQQEIYIESENLKLGIDLLWGGALSYLEDTDSNVQAVSVDGKIKVDMGFKNYGFSAAFNLTSGFAILNDKYEVVSEVEVGDPTKWYSHDPENWKSNVVLDHSITAELDAPTEKGTYYVAFYLKNTMGVGAQLSNSVQFENNQNLLFAFNV